MIRITQMDTLPDELLVEIFRAFAASVTQRSSLEERKAMYYHMSELQQVCKRWCKLARHDLVWKHFEIVEDIDPYPPLDSTHSSLLLLLLIYWKRTFLF
jgi:hypothetical protein